MAADTDTLWDGIAAERRAQILASPWPHLDYLREFIGLEEIKGSADQAIIVAWGQAAGIDWWHGDDDPWCAVAVNGAVVAAGGTGTGSALARSFCRTGTPLERPVKGAIGVTPRGPDPLYGHVFIIDEVLPDGTMRVVNGNVGDAVTHSTVKVDSLLPDGLVWPAGIPMTDEAKAAAGERPRALGSRTLRVHDDGPDVAALQRALTRLGVEPRLQGLGIFGPKTLEAVRAFQRRAGLVVDGIAGPATFAALERALEDHEARATGERAAAPAAAGGVAGGAALATAAATVVAELEGAARTVGESVGAIGEAGPAAIALVAACLAAVIGWGAWRAVRGARVAA